MNCLFYEDNLDTCGLCDIRSDHFDDTAEPSNITGLNTCIDPEDDSCSHYEEAEDY